MTMKGAACTILLGLLGVCQASTTSLQVLDPFDITRLYGKCWYNYCFSGSAECVVTEYVEDKECTNRFNVTETAVIVETDELSVTYGYGEPANNEGQEAKFYFYMKIVDELGVVDYVKANIWVLAEVSVGYGSCCFILYNPGDGTVETVCPQPLYEDCTELEANLEAAFCRIQEQGGPCRVQCVTKDNSCCQF